MKTIKSLFFLVFALSQAMCVVAQGNSLNSPTKQFGYWNQKEVHEGDVSISIYPILNDYGENELRINLSQNYYKSGVYNPGGFVMPEYIYYYGTDEVKVKCIRTSGYIRTYEYSFEYKEERSNVPISMAKTYSFKMNSESGFEPRSGDIIKIYLNNNIVAIYNLPSEDYFDNFIVAARKNSSLLAQYKQQQMQMIMGVNQMISQQNSSYSTNNSGSSYSSSKICSFCNGTGVSPIRKSVATYGNYSTVYCDVCKDYSSPHYHERCPSCMGR